MGRVGKGLLYRPQPIGQAAAGIQQAKVSLPLPIRLRGGHDGVCVKNTIQQDSVHIRLCRGDILSVYLHAVPVLCQIPLGQCAAPNGDAQSLRGIGEGSFPGGKGPGSLHRHVLREKPFLPGLTRDQYHIPDVEGFGG